MSLVRLAELRERSRNATPSGLTAELTHAVDAALEEMSAATDLAGVALIATGGYGAGRLCLHSDVDLMFLRLGKLTPDSVRTILDPLWAAGLKVGHAVRTPREAADLAKTDTATLSSLLTMRRLVGSEEAFADLEQRLGKLVKRRLRQIRATWADEEAARRRHAPYRFMATDLKTGRGGVRCLQTIEWNRRTLELVGMETQRSADEDRWWDTLTMTRNALHAAAQRAHDRYDFELRAEAARHVGLTQTELGRRILETMREVESAVASLFPELLPPIADAPSRVRVPVPDDAVLGTAVHAVVAGRTLTEAEMSEAARAVQPAWGRADLRALVYLLEPGWARAVMYQLSESGWLERTMPEWSAIRDQPHIVPFHSHPVADHLLRTVDELLEVLEESDHPVRPVAAEDRRILILGAWLHDVGKGSGGDHSIKGAGAAAAVAARLHLTDDETRLLVTLVEHHLLLPDLATQHDVADHVVMAEALDAIGSPRVLDLLYLLSVADSRATGPGGWTPWKAALLRRAHAAVREALAQRSLAAPAFEELVTAVAAHGVAESAVRRHLELIPSSERAAAPPTQVADDITIATPPPDPGEVRLRYSSGEGTTHLTLCTRDVTGLLAKTSGVLALHNVSVIDAHLATRADGVVIDRFEVVDALTAEPIADDRLRAAQRDLVAAMAGDLDVAAAVAAKQHAYRGRVQAGIATSVALRARPVGCSVELQGADRLGLLHDVALVFARHGLSIRRARIDTRGGTAVDVFYTRTPPANPEALKRDLLDLFA